MRRNSLISYRLLPIIGSVLLLSGCGTKTPEEGVEAAQSALAQSNYDAAIVELKTVLQQSPKLAQARYLLGKAYFANAQYAFAEKELERAKELGYSVAEIIPLLSQVYQRNNTLVGLQNLDPSWTDLANKEKVQVGYYRVQSLVELKQTDEAISLLDELIAVEADSVYVELVLAMAEVVKKQSINGAIGILEKARQSYPQNRDLLNFLAKSYISNKQQRLAVETLQAYSDIAKDDLEAQFLLAQMYVELEQHEKALPMLAKLLQIAPNNPRLHLLNSIAHTLNNDLDAALLASEKSISLGFDSNRARLVASFNAFNLGRFATVVEHLGSIADLLPEGHSALNILAASYLELGKAKEAKAILVRISPESHSYQNLLHRTGFALLNDGFSEAARELITDNAQYHADVAGDQQARLGALKLSLQDISGLLDIESALDNMTDKAIGYRVLASSYVRLQDKEKAYALAEKWQKELPASYEPWLLKGELALYERDFTAAKSAFAEAIKRSPNEPRALISQVNLAITQKDYTKAIAESEALLTQFGDNVTLLKMNYALRKRHSDANDLLNHAQRAYTATKTPELAMVLVEMHIAEQNFTAALAVLEQTSDIETAPNYWLLKAQTLASLQRSEALMEHSKRWLVEEPNNGFAMATALLMYDEQQDYVAGLAFLEQYPEQLQRAQIQVLKAKFLLLSSRILEARNTFDKVPEAFRKQPFALAVEAKLLGTEGEYLAAEKAIAAAYAARPIVKHLLVYIEILNRLDKTAKGLALLEAHHRLEPEDKMVKVLLAERYFYQQPATAERLYRELLEDVPDNLIVLNNLAYLLKEQGLIEESIDFAKQAYTLQPSNIAVVDTLAQIYTLQGNHGEAVKLYKSVMKKEQGSTMVILNYIEALLKNNEIRLAQRELDSRQWSSEIDLDRIEMMKATFNL